VVSPATPGFKRAGRLGTCSAAHVRRPIGDETTPTHVRRVCLPSLPPAAAAAAAAAVASVAADRNQNTRKSNGGEEPGRRSATIAPVTRLPACLRSVAACCEARGKCRRSDTKLAVESIDRLAGWLAAGPVQCAFGDESAR